MISAYIFLGMAIGIVIGMQYYKYQILKKKNRRTTRLNFSGTPTTRSLTNKNAKKHGPRCPRKTGPLA